MEDEKKPLEGEVSQPEVNDESKVNDRPEQNYRAEISRKDAEIERLRLQVESSKINSEQRRDPSDIRTWSDHELKMLVKSNDPTVTGYKDQADEILLERKVRAIQARERNDQRRVAADLEIREQHPEALDPSSEMYSKMQRIMNEYDLEKTPAGRLVAAKIAAAELSKGVSTSDAKARKKEDDRRRDVKANMVDGDRAKPTEPQGLTPDKRKRLEERVMKGDDLAVGELLQEKGLTRDSLFGKR